MSSLNCLTPKDFAKDHHKKGYKEIGRSYVKIIFKQDDYTITKPHCDDGYEHIVWNNDEPIAEFKNFDDAHDFIKLKLK